MAIQGIPAAVAASVLHSAAAGVFQPALRAWDYRINTTWPNNAPTAHECFKLFTQTSLDWEFLERIWRQQGIDAGTNEPVFSRMPPGGGVLPAVPLPPGVRRNSAANPANWPHFAWWAYIKAQQTPPPLDALLAFQIMGRTIDPAALRALEITEDSSPAIIEEWIRRYGIREPLSKWLMVNKPYIYSPEVARVLLALENLEPSLVSRTGTTYRTQNENRQTFRNRMTAAGMGNTEDREAFARLVQPPTYHEVIQLLNRDLLRDHNAPRQQEEEDTPQRKEFNRLMALEGFTEPAIVDYLHELRKEIPTTADLIAMSVKNVFDKHLAHTLRLDDEYEEQPQYIIWTDRTGFTGNPTISNEDMRKHILAHREETINSGQIPTDAHGNPETEDDTKARADRYYNSQDKTLQTWAQAHWREHWVNLSPTQIYTGLHRCRPIDLTRTGAADAQAAYEFQLRYFAIDEHDTPEVAGAKAERRYQLATQYAATFGRIINVPGTTLPVPPVTMDIVRTVLRANDYAPLFRDTLAAISYNTLRLVDIRRMVQQALKDEAFAVSAIGWTPGRSMEAEAAILRVPADTPPLRVYVQAWAREQYLDRGQTPDSALSLSTLAIQQGAATNSAVATLQNPAGRRRWVRLLEKAYRVGVITAENFVALARRAGAKGIGNIIVQDDVYADVFAEEDATADSAAASALASDDNLLIAEEFAEDFFSEEFAGAG